MERRVVCYTLPHKVVVWAKMVLYAAEGQANTEIACRLESAADVVGRWRKRVYEERLAGLEDRERAGRPRGCAGFCVSDWFVRPGRDDRGVAA